MQTRNHARWNLPSFKNIDLKICKSKAEEEQLFKKRYECYLDAQAIEPFRNGIMKDHYDELATTYNQAAYEDGRLIGGIRGVVYVPEKSEDVPAREVYENEISREIGWGDSFLESCRFINDGFTGRSPIPSIALIRSNIILALSQGTRHIITAARMKHVPFYENIGMKLVSSQKIYPGLHVEMALLIGFDIQNRSYPFIKKYISDQDVATYKEILSLPKSPAYV